MGMVNNVQTAWKIYQTVRGFTKKRGSEQAADRPEALTRIGKLLGGGPSTPVSDAAPKVQAPAETHTGELTAGSVAGAVARPLLKRVKRTLIKTGVTVGVVAVGATAGRLYLRQKFNI